MATLLFLLREAPWLGPDRALAWTRVLAGASALSALALILVTHGGTTPDPWARPLAPDFVSFWTAGKLALQGTPGSAWDPAAHAAAEHTSFTPDAGYNGDYYGFFYPPSFLLICVPLALLPYGIAVAAWLATTGAAYFATIRALLPPRWPALLVAVAYPAVLLNTAHGQNGALFTTLLGLAALQLERRPWLAGACLGALSIKPHLALLVVPALFAARRWRALAWAVVVTATLFLVSLLVVHEAVWRAFIANLAVAQAALQAGLGQLCQDGQPIRRCTSARREHLRRLADPNCRVRRGSRDPNHRGSSQTGSARRRCDPCRVHLPRDALPA